MKKGEITVLSAIGVTALIVIVIIANARGTERTLAAGELYRAYATSPQSISAELKDFAGISARGTWRVEITRGEEWKVDLFYPEDAENRPWVGVEGNLLILAQRSDSWRFWDNWGSPRAVPTARIVMPALDELWVSGAGKAQFRGFSGDRLAIRVSGAGKIDGADGQYEQLALTVSGAGDVDISDIVFTDARTRLSGAANVSLTMDGGVLSGRISGAGKIAYRGSVSDVRITTSGAAVVRHES